MPWFLLDFAHNPMTYLTLLGAGLVLLMVFLASPSTFFKVIADPKCWLIIVVMAVIYGYMHLNNKNAALQTQLDHFQAQQQSKSDAQTVVQNKATKQKTRQAERDSVNASISTAKPGQAFDDALDEIARIQAGAPDGVQPAPDSVHDSHANQNGDGHADGVVVP